MKNGRYLLQIDCVRGKRGGHGKTRPRRRAQHEFADDLPVRESMRQPYLGNRKNDSGKVYNVLKHFLRGRVGQCWDAVYSELCRGLRRDHELDAYAREWVNSWVLRNVRIDEDGEPRELPQDCRLWNDFYVHPENGTLQFAGTPSRPKSQRKPIVETRTAGGVVLYAKDRGIWYQITLARIPTVQQVRDQVAPYISNSGLINQQWVRPRGPVDVILRARAVAQDDEELNTETHWKTSSCLRVFRAAWGDMVYASHKRQLNGDELAREGLRNNVMA